MWFELKSKNLSKSENVRIFFYNESLKELNITTLKQRRDNLCVNLARKWLQGYKNTKDIFERIMTKRRMKVRNLDYFKVKHCGTNIMKTSAIINMTKKLNNHIKKKEKLLNV